MVDDFIDIKLTEAALDISVSYDFILDEACGGISIFIGTVRNLNKGKAVTHLSFEAYEPMALKELQKIAQECKTQFGINKISIQHRLGKVLLSEIAVIIAISSVHRKAAMMAVEFTMNKLKETVPIWKKEFHPDGSYWVNARP